MNGENFNADKQQSENPASVLEDMPSFEDMQKKRELERQNWEAREDAEINSLLAEMNDPEAKIVFGNMSIDANDYSSKENNLNGSHSRGVADKFAIWAAAKFYSDMVGLDGDSAKDRYSEEFEIVRDLWKGDSIQAQKIECATKIGMNYFESWQEGEEPGGRYVEMMAEKLGRIENVVDVLYNEGESRYQKYEDRQRRKGEAQ